MPLQYLSLGYSRTFSCSNFPVVLLWYIELNNSSVKMNKNLSPYRTTISQMHDPITAGNIQHHIVHHHTIPYRTIQHYTVTYITIPYHTVPSIKSVYKSCKMKCGSPARKTCSRYRGRRLFLLHGRSRRYCIRPSVRLFVALKNQTRCTVVGTVFRREP